MAGWNDVASNDSWETSDATAADVSTDEASAAADLAAMFGGADAAAGLNDWTAPSPAAGDAPAEADLAELFAGDATASGVNDWTVPADEQPAGPPPAVGASGGDDLFTDLFGDGDGPAVEQPGPADADTEDREAPADADTEDREAPAATGDDEPASADGAVTEVSIGTGDALAGTDGTDDATEQHTDEPAAASAPEPAASEERPDPPTATVAPGPSGKKRLSLADKLARQQAASHSDHAVLEQVGLEAWGAQRYLDGGRLWGHVDRILGYVASQHDLQIQLKDVAITRDAYVDAEQRRLIESLIRPRLIDANVHIDNTADIPLIFDILLDEWTGISVLGPLWRDDDVTEIMVDAHDRIVIERDGSLQLTPITFRSAIHAMEVARNLSQKVSDRAVNESNPIVTAELPGARLHFAVGKVVRTGLSISIRKFAPLMGIEKLLELGAMSREMADFLDDAIGRGRANVLVSGGTGTGKTTMLNAISSFIPATERVVTIEDSFELTLQNELVVAMQTKEASTADSKSSVGMAELLRSALRMRPDRIVVGEIRGPEAQVMLQAANTGHDGTMSTIHANDPTSCLSFRLPDMLLQARAMPEPVARRQVASAVDLVIQISRRAGRRFVSAIATVDVTDQTDDAIAPHLLFEGDLGADGAPVHRRVGALRTDTDLSIKMADYGADVARWAAPPEEV